ncbi:MAG: DUF1858 domain-containing protein [Calditrichaeota bacterium]|nr:DUF1858 domain-containing protein [Calditrichota bacterium]
MDGDTSIEDLVSRYPRSVRFLMEKGIKCLACGEPIWGTVASSARAKGFSEVQIQALVQELNKFISEG